MIPAQAGIYFSACAMFLVYILASRHYGTLYVGYANDLARRVSEHKTKAVPGFTSKYQVDRLVWFEAHETLESALLRERQIKRWNRDWKINPIEDENPHWIDLYPSIAPKIRRVDHVAEIGLGLRRKPWI